MFYSAFSRWRANEPASRGRLALDAARRALLNRLEGGEESDTPASLLGRAPSYEALRARDPLVAVVGAGGLGCPAALGLAVAGVRRIRIIDDDRVELSNLPRQILHRDDDLGHPKATSAAESLETLRGDLDLDPVVERLGTGNYERLLGDADLILDASDNFPTKFLVNAAAQLLGIPAVIAGVIKYEGQCITVQPREHESACYRCLFPAAPAPGALPTCSTVGVLGPAAGVVALQQVGLGLSLIGEEASGGGLWLYEGRGGNWLSLQGGRNPDCLACGSERDDPSLRGATERSGTICATPR